MFKHPFWSWLTRIELLFALSIGVGVILFVIGITLPVYTDFEAAYAIKLNACNADGPIEGWSKPLVALQTWRHPLMQGGFSLLLAGATLWILFWKFADDGRSAIGTPRTRWSYFALGTLVIVISFVSQIVSLGLDVGRGEVPWCADSVGIPLIGLMISYLILFGLCLAVGAIVAHGFGPLPQPLFVWRKDRAVLSWTVTLVLCVIAAPIIFFGALSAADSAFLGTPAAILALYLVESTRSALLAQKPAYETGTV